MTAEPRGRVVAIDALRGLVIVLMALDHARDFFHVGAMSGSPTDLATTTPLLFATRWVTHFCAPVFLLLAGLGAALRLQRPGQGARSVARYLWVRGAWLVLLEVTVMRLAITFSPSRQWPLLLLVLWVLGLSMIVLAALLRVPSAWLLVGSLLVIALHNLTDAVQPEAFGTLAPIWTVLHQPGVVTLGDVVVVVGYPLVPWVAVMVAGFAMGEMYRWPADVRQRWLTRAGLGLVTLFLILRAANVYGDPAPWQAHASPTLTLLSFLNTTKYPPSLQFLAMTIGPALVALAVLERTRRSLHGLVVLGRAPLFFYVAHFWLLHALVVVASLVTYGRDAWRFAFMPVPSMGGPADAFPPGFGYPLWVTWVAWVTVLVWLYPACRRLGERGGTASGRAGSPSPP